MCLADGVIEEDELIRRLEEAGKQLVDEREASTAEDLLLAKCASC